jgi:hypothetical protein
MALLGIVWRVSKLAAQVPGNPSSSVNTTSVGMLRIVEVIGATVSAFRTAIAESQVRIMWIALHILVHIGVTRRWRGSPAIRAMEINDLGPALGSYARPVPSQTESTAEA